MKPFEAISLFLLCVLLTAIGAAFNGCERPEDHVIKPQIPAHVHKNLP